MKISEIFYSIQGEGMRIGIPSVFIRTSGCNLKCKWCDSKYASDGKQMTIAEILKSVERFGSVPDVVITGGEPFMQKDLYKLTVKLRENYYITIETNGTIQAPFPFFAHMLSISPKMSNSSSNNKTDRQILGELLRSSHHQQLKFVISQESDINEVLALLEWLTSYPVTLGSKLSTESAFTIFLMPEGKTPEEIRKKSPMVVELCKKYGFRYSPRAHIDIWGCKRGR